MSIFAGLQLSFPGVATETGLIDPSLAQTDTPGLEIKVLQVATQTFQVYCCAVLPTEFFSQIFVAYDTGNLFFYTNREDCFRVQKVMTINTACRQFVALVKKIKIFHIGGQQTLHHLKIEFQLQAVRDHSKIVFSRVKRQPEMQVGISVISHFD
jgi:hypothetical protein